MGIIKLATYAGCRIRVLEGDLTTHSAQAFVNAANDKMQHDSGIAQKLSEKDGENMSKESQKIVQEKYNGKLPAGECISTKANELKSCKYIIHAVGPDCTISEQKANRFKLIEKVTTSFLNEAQRLGCTSVATTLISTKEFNMPAAEAAQGTIFALKQWLDGNPNTKVQRVDFIDMDRTDLGHYEDEVQRQMSEDDDTVQVPDEADQMCSGDPWSDTTPLKQQTQASANQFWKGDQWSETTPVKQQTQAPTTQFWKGASSPKSSPKIKQANVSTGQGLKGTSPKISPVKDEFEIPMGQYWREAPDYSKRPPLKDKSAKSVPDKYWTEAPDYSKRWPLKDKSAKSVNNKYWTEEDLAREFGPSHSPTKALAPRSYQQYKPSSPAAIETSTNSKAGDGYQSPRMMLKVEKWLSRQDVPQVAPRSYPQLKTTSDSPHRRYSPVTADLAPRSYKPSSPVSAEKYKTPVREPPPTSAPFGWSEDLYRSKTIPSQPKTGFCGQSGSSYGQGSAVEEKIWELEYLIKQTRHKRGQIQCERENAKAQEEELERDIQYAMAKKNELVHHSAVQREARYDVRQRRCSSQYGGKTRRDEQMVVEQLQQYLSPYEQSGRVRQQAAYGARC